MISPGSDKSSIYIEKTERNVFKKPDNQTSYRNHPNLAHYDVARFVLTQEPHIAPVPRARFTAFATTPTRAPTRPAT
jgi:hypothetical protein